MRSLMIREMLFQNYTYCSNSSIYRNQSLVVILILFKVCITISLDIRKIVICNNDYFFILLSMNIKGQSCLRIQMQIRKKESIFICSTNGDQRKSFAYFDICIYYEHVCMQLGNTKYIVYKLFDVLVIHSIL